MMLSYFVIATLKQLNNNINLRLRFLSEYSIFVITFNIHNILSLDWYINHVTIYIFWVFEYILFTQ